MLRIAHLSDIHIFNLQRHDEYRIQFEKLYKKLKELKLYRIVLVGDLFESFVSISNEAKELAGEFLTNLSNIAKLIIVHGNHEVLSKNKNRVNSIRPIVKLLNNPNILYLEKSGFYEEHKIIWVNYSHLEKHINPWTDIPHTKNDNKIYIGLFHDPINNSVTDLGLTFTDKRYKNISYFVDNDYVMLGDIHRRSFFRNNKSMAYSGSLIGQNHGENVDGHGFLLWNITNKDNFTVDEYDLPNDYNYITFIINQNTDYDNLTFESKHLNPKSNIRIKWQDISANVNFENESKIRQYFKNKYNLPKIKIKKEAIYTDILGVEMINESIDLTNTETQKDIFIEFLKLNGYEDEFIESVLDIDFIINDRMNLSASSLGISWSINKFWFENFKSYGDKTEINFNELGNNIIIQLTGINQQGKTTILDAICYILYGKTMSTLKREKNSDNRYINNKRDLDFCDGGAVISINGEEYTILRRTERKWNRKKTEIVSCSTIVKYYLGTKIDDEHNLTDEQKKDTQNIIEDAIGDFTDFIRLVLTTADNLNDLISMDRAIFIDSIIRDAGYDIFEKKLEEFKKYKKELNSSRIDFDLKEYEYNKEKLNEHKTSLNFDLISKNKEIELVENEKKPFIDEKDTYLSQLEKIDESLKDFNLDNVNDKILKEKEIIHKRNTQLIKIEELSEDIKDYSDVKLIDKKNRLNDLKDNINNLNINSKDLDIEIGNLTSDVKTINMDIKNIIDGHIRTLKKEIETNDMQSYKLKTEFNNIVSKYLKEVSNKLNELTIEKNSIEHKIDNLMNEGKLLKLENDKLEHSKICITCHRPLEEKDILVIAETIEENKVKMQSIMDEVKLLKSKFYDLLDDIEEQNVIIRKISDEDYEFNDNLNESYKLITDKIVNYKNNNEEINKNIGLIKDGNISPNLRLKLKSSYDQKEFILDKITNKDEEKEKITSHISYRRGTVEILKSDIIILEEEDAEYQKKLKIIQLEDKINLEITNCNLQIINYEKSIETYNNELHKIEDNIKLQIKIDDLDKLLGELDIDIKEKLNDKSNIDANIMLVDSKLEYLEENLIKFKEQQRKDDILNTYLKCVHRDGIPTYLLRKSITIINQELNNILTDVDYTIYFDDELNLKLSSDSRLDASISVISASGMERTFSAVSLRMALRKINQKNIPNFLIYDEIMSKLVGESVDKFTLLLDTIKNEVDKLLIIEHDKVINYDYLITVEKDEQGISNLVIE